MVRIHAVHNLLRIDNAISSEEKKPYETNLIKFESKYLEGNIRQVQNCQMELDERKQQIAKIETKVTVDAHKWWTDAAGAHKWWTDVLKDNQDEKAENSNELLNEIKELIKPRQIKKVTKDAHDWWTDVMEENRDKYAKNSNKLLDQIKKLIKPYLIQEADGVNFVIAKWMHNVMANREMVYKAFDELRIFCGNFQQIAEMRKEARKNLASFLNHATACHLAEDLSSDLTVIYV